MPVTIVTGAQWGDEGKGRVVDSYAAHADVVARFGGGDNAGHTVYVNDVVYKFHLIPSGILHQNAMCVLGNGMVVNPINLLAEMDRIAAMGVEVSPQRLMLSTRAHIITPAHIALDAASEKQRGEEAIGTTLRGIGPAYLDKTGRTGIRAGEMLSVENFADAIHKQIERANAELSRSGLDLLDPKKEAMAYIETAERLRPYLGDTIEYVNRRLKDGAEMLAEGAQGTLLDIDYGSYPFVTSSSPTAGGALTGLGFGPRYIEQVIGVAKSFTTRVGGGPMPTELDGPVAAHLRGTGDNFWDEFGTTTGRERRCGWLDTVLLRYAADVNGFTELVLTKLDILSGLDEIKLATAYEIDGQRREYPPSTIPELARAKPIYETMPGWGEDVSAARNISEMPQAAVDYIKRVSELCDVPVTMLSVGPAREQVVMV